MKAANDSCGLVLRGHEESLVGAGVWLIFVDFFFSGYDLKSAGAGGGLGTWFCRFVAGQREVGASTKEVPKKTG